MRSRFELDAVPDVVEWLKQTTDAVTTDADESADAVLERMARLGRQDAGHTDGHDTQPSPAPATPAMSTKPATSPETSPPPSNPRPRTNRRAAANHRRHLEHVKHGIRLRPMTPKPPTETKLAAMTAAARRQAEKKAETDRRRALHRHTNQLAFNNHVRRCRLFTRKVIHDFLRYDLRAGDPNKNRPQCISYGDDRVSYGAEIRWWAKRCSAASVGSMRTDSKLSKSLDLSWRRRVELRVSIDGAKARRDAIDAIDAQKVEARKELRELHAQLRQSQKDSRHGIRRGWLPPPVREELQRQRRVADAAGHRAPSLAQFVEDLRVKHSATSEAGRSCVDNNLWGILMSHEVAAARKNSWFQRLWAEHRLSLGMSVGRCREVDGRDGARCGCHRASQYGANYGLLPVRRGPYSKVTSASFGAMVRSEMLDAQRDGNDPDALFFRLDEYTTSGTCSSCRRKLGHSNNGSVALCSCGVTAQRDVTSSLNQWDLSAAFLLFGRRCLHLTPGIRRKNLNHFRYGLC